MKRKALGKGLGALLPDPEPGPDSAAEVPVESLEPNPFQPRAPIRPEQLQDLTDRERARGGAGELPASRQVVRELIEFAGRVIGPHKRRNAAIVYVGTPLRQGRNCRPRPPRHVNDQGDPKRTISMRVILALGGHGTRRGRTCRLSPVTSNQGREQLQ